MTKAILDTVSQLAKAELAWIMKERDLDTERREKLVSRIGDEPELPF